MSAPTSSSVSQLATTPPAPVAPAAPGRFGPAFRPAPLPAPRSGTRLGPPKRPLSAAWDRVVAIRVDLAIVVGLLIVAGVVNGINLGGSPAFFDDEGTYVAQSWAVTSLGQLAPYTYWYDHPPLGWLVMAGWSLLTDGLLGSGPSIAEARSLMLVLTLVNAALVYVIARRLRMHRMFAALAVALFALSPLAVYYHRMVLLDNIAVTGLLAAFALALSPARRLAAFAAAGLCFAAALLTKETMMLALPALVLLAWQNSKGPTRGFALGVLLAGCAVVAAFYPLFATLQGELFHGAGHTSLVDGIRFQLTRPGSGGVLDPRSGARQLIDAWLRHDPVLPSAAIVLVPIALAFIPRLRAVALAIAVPVVVAARPTAYVPAMFVIGLIPFAALLVAGLADEIFQGGVARGPGVLRQGLGLVPALALIALALELAVLFGPRWIDGNVQQMRRDDAAPARQAVDWIAGHVDRRSTIVVDDTIWLDLVQRGFARERMIWFYKLDLDPAVMRPRASIDYVVRSNLMAGNVRDLPRTRDLLVNSRPVAVFSAGDERFEIRRVSSPQTAVGAGTG
jgi:hypothetical protein